MKSAPFIPPDDDPSALTELDGTVIPRAMPRRPRVAQTRLDFGDGNGLPEDESEPVTADQWRREFERTWPRPR